MKHIYTNNDATGKIILIQNEEQFDRYYHQQERDPKYYTIAWNKGKSPVVTIDEVDYAMGADFILPIMMSQSFTFERPEDIIAWQFNREFYCIVNHDAEVGCVGFLFYGPSPVMLLQLDSAEADKMHRLLNLFEEELFRKQI